MHNEIPAAAAKTGPYQLKHVAVPVVLRLDQEDRPFHVHWNMQLFRTAVDIHQQEVIQQQVFNEVILVKPFLVGYQKRLDLEGCHFPDRIDILSGSPCHKDILQLRLVEYFEKLAALDLLAVRRGSGEIPCRLCAVFHFL